MIRRPVRMADKTWDASRAELELWVRDATAELLRLLSTWSPLRETVEEAVDTLEADKVPITRVVATTSPLAGGGDLSVDRTLSLTESAVTHNNLGGRSTAGAHPATAITNTPVGTILATTVQAAIDELADDAAFHAAFLGGA